MKGIIFNLLEQFVVENWGAETYEKILAKCPLTTREPFVGPLTYPDGDLLAIVGAVCGELGVTTQDALRAFGRFAFPRLASRHPELVKGRVDPLALLLSVENVIHVEVRKLYPDAITPEFEFESLKAGSLVMRYRSRRRLCPLVVGLIEGVAEHFDTSIDCEETACTSAGADACTFKLSFARVPAEAL